MKTHRSDIQAVIAAAIIAAAPIIGCSGGLGSTTNPIDLSKSLALTNYTGCDELEAEIKEMLIGEMERNLDNMGDFCNFRGEPIPLAAPEGGDVAAESDAAQATGTNVQEEGVDEADLIKTDGRHAYAVINGGVKIVRVWPFDQFGTVANIATEHAPRGLYLSGERLIVITGTTANDEVGIYYPSIPTISAETFVEIYDVSQPDNPLLIRRTAYTGELMASRLIDSRIHLIVRGAGVVYPAFDYDLGIDYADIPVCSSDTSGTSPAVTAAIERLKEKNRALVNALTLTELMPDIGAIGSVACTDVARAKAASGTSLMVIASETFVDGASAPAKAAILSNGGTVYASVHALYVASSASVFGWWNLADYGFVDATILHRFALNAGAPAYSGSNMVDGRLVDNFYAGSRYSERFSMAQFSMSEYEGHLRIATTFTDYSDPLFTMDNRVTVLNTATAALEKVGVVTGLGLGERIFATRFIGPRGYVVTFRQVDPLYVLDLSNPAAPAVTGELKIPGFSTYLHPLDEDHLIGLGFATDDADAFTWTQGLKLALFNVSDPANPREVNSRELGSRGSYSAAVEEHHAFTLDRERGMLALPVELYTGGGSWDYGTLSFSGVVVLNIDLNGAFETIGNIAIPGASNRAYSDAHVLRTVILGDGGADDGVISLTTNTLRLNRIDATMSTVGVVE